MSVRVKRDHRSAGWLLSAIAMVATALVVGSGGASTSAAATSIPIVVDETDSDFEYRTRTLDDGRVMFQRPNGDVAVFDPAAGSIETLASDAVIDSGRRLPYVANTRDSTGAPGESRIFYRSSTDALRVIDPETGAIRTLGALPAGSSIRDIELLDDRRTVLLELQVSSSPTIISWYVFDAFATTLPPAADTYERDTSTANNAVQPGVIGYVRGSDADTEFWTVDRDGARRIVALPWIIDYDYSFDDGQLLLTTDVGNAGTFEFHLSSLEGETPTKVHESTTTDRARISFDERVLVVEPDVVATDDRFTDWVLETPPLPAGATNERSSVSFRDGRLIVRWSWTVAGEREDGPAWSYAFDGTDRVDAPPPPEPPTFDPNRIELFWGGVVEIVDEPGGNRTLLYTDPVDGSTSTIESGATLERISVAVGSGRLEYIRDDSSFVSHRLRSDETIAVALPRGPGGDVRWFRPSQQQRSTLLLQQRCTVFDTCSGSGLYAVDVPLAQIPRAMQSLAPARLLDTRSPGETVDGAFRGAGRVAAGSVTEFAVRDRGGVPDLAGTAMLNLTAVNPSGRGFLSVYACDLPERPNASNVNFEAGQNVANAVLAALSADGDICVYSSTEAHIVVDVNGFSIRGTSIGALEPERFVDTRATGETFDGEQQRGGRLGDGETFRVRVLGRGDVVSPLDEFVEEAGLSRAVLLNVTAVNPSDRGFLTIFGCGVDRPTASNLNYVAGRNVANAVVASPGSDGEVCVYTSSATDLIVDVNGQDTSPFNTQPVTPARYVDTRATGETFDGNQQGDGRLAAGATFEVDLDRGPIEPSAGAAFVNVTAVNPSDKGFLTVFPCDVTRPTASNVNFEAGQNVPNTVLAKISADRTICVYSSVETDLIVDANAYAFDLDSELSQQGPG